MNCSIKILDLSRNEIGGKGTQILVKALYDDIYGTNIKSLDLSYNFVRDEGAKSLATLVKGSSAAKYGGLSELRIQGNEIGLEGMSAIFKVLAQVKMSGRSKKEMRPETVSKLKILDIS